jgi:outer membrane lipoprotein carrier protein
MKKYISLTFLVLFSFTLIAQSQQDRAAEAKGEQLLKEASQHIKSFRALKIQFTYEMENSGQNVKETMKGELLSQGDRYNMSLSGNLFISDGTNTWSYLEEMNEVYVNLLENTEGGLTPTSILNEFETQFKAKHIRQETHKGKRVEVIDLVPTTPQAFYKYRVALDAASKMLVYTIAYDREGGTYTYTMDRVETNPTIPAGQFTFTASRFPGVEVIDLR